MLGAVVLAWLLLFGQRGHGAPPPPRPAVHVCPSWGCDGYPWPLRPVPATVHVCPSWGCDGYPWPIRPVS